MFDERKMLVTGGSGLLGSSLKLHFPNSFFPSKDEFDVRNLEQMDYYLSKKNIETLFHGAAFTSPPKIDQDPINALTSNIIGTANVVTLAFKYKFSLIYVCTDYVFKGDKGNYKEDDSMYPVNKYAWSKLGGECAVRMYNNHLIIRTSFGPNIFPFQKAFTDQWTSRVPVSEASNMIAQLIRGEIKGVMNVGGTRKTVYEYAKSLDPSKEIGELSIQDVPFTVPVDTSLNAELVNKLIKTKSYDEK
jgi:dTDP-4-dehydrorhamnose reductase